jgi:hypothetical protein
MHRGEVRFPIPTRPRRRWQALDFILAYALNDDGASGRVVEPAGEDFLIFRRVVPALARRCVGEFEDDDAFGLRSALDQFGCTGAGQEATAILLDRGADRRLGQGSIASGLVISSSTTK